MWLNLAAEQGDGFAQLLVGLMYARAMGTPEDYVLAHMGLNLAAEQGVAPAVKSRDMVARLMHPGPTRRGAAPGA